MPADPIEQFIAWYREAESIKLHEPNAMTLSTVDHLGMPDSRVVLLKEIDDKGFVFFTHYDSEKAQQIAAHPVAALNFYWSELAHQVRVRGRVERISSERSADYFASRSRESQLTVYASPQRQAIDEQTLIQQIAKISAQFHNQPIPCPPYWGGYCVIPVTIEFFQGRRGRLHDRIRYTREENDQWVITRLAP